MTRFAAALLMALLAGCAAQPPAPPVDWSDRRETLTVLDEWEARGRLAVQSGQDGAQGSLLWNQAGENAQIRVSGPFGAGAYLIEWNREAVRVTDKNGEVGAEYLGDDAAGRFLDDQLGWSFPAISTRYWILGVPNPARDSREEFDSEGRLVRIVQDGWVVDYREFRQQRNILLPRKIVMNSENGKVKLVVDRWTF